MMELLQARGRIGVPELAKRLEVGERTVAATPRCSERWECPSRPKSVATEATVCGRRLPPMMFTEEEALGLLWVCWPLEAWGSRV